MKSTLTLSIILLIAIQLPAQTITDQLKDLGVFREKIVFERINETDLPESAPLVVVDWEFKPVYYKKIDPSKIIRIEELDRQLAKHLYKNEKAYRLVVDEKTNAEAVFKIVSHPPFHASCPTDYTKKEKEKCTKNYLEQALKGLLIDQDLFVLEIIIDRTGSITETNILKGKSNSKLESFLKAWKKEKFNWYPGRQRNNFVNCSYVFEHRQE